MRHRIKKAILNRPADQRKALVRNLVTSLFLYGKVKTTVAKAKALASEAEHLITKIKNQKEDHNAIKEAMRVVTTEASSRNLIEYAQKSDRNSGYTRSTKIGYRAGDNALMVLVELIPNEDTK